jgi:hypothetical protein
MQTAHRRRAGRRHGSRATALVTALVLWLGGCAVSVPVKETAVEEELPDKASGIVVGQSDRTAVRAQLGEPWLTSDYWRFDLFRVAGRNVSAPVMFVFWWPVPLGVAVDTMIGYVLVAYDADGRVAAEQHGFAHDPSIFSEGAGFASGTQIESADLQFKTADDQVDHAFLSVGPERRDSFLRAYPSRDGCRLLLGCAGWNCSARVAIDGQPAVELQGSTVKLDIRELTPVRSGAGHHRVQITPAGIGSKFEAATEFSCTAGETLYGLIELEVEKIKFLGKEFSAAINVSTEIPEAFRDRGLLVWGEGQWLVPQEPGD